MNHLMQRVNKEIVWQEVQIDGLAQDCRNPIAF